jgi:hypothetical protein
VVIVPLLLRVKLPEDIVEVPIVQPEIVLDANPRVNLPDAVDPPLEL